MSIQTEPAQLAEWTALGEFLDEMSQRQSAVDFDRSLDDWETGLRRFLDAELYHAGHHEVEEMDLPTHLRCLRALLEMGENLVTWCESGKLPAKTQRHIQIGLEMLDDSKHAYHHGRSEEELERIRGIIFGAEA